MNSDDNEIALTRNEEHLVLQKDAVEGGTVRAHKTVSSEHVSAPTTRQVEDYDRLDRVPADEADSGQIEKLADGSISIPILEEELVITKRLVVRERVILRKHITITHETVEANLRREQIIVEIDPPAV